MKKFLLLMIIGMLLLAGLGAVALSGEDAKKEKTIYYFSRFSIKEEDDYITLELVGTNSVLIKKDHYMVPTHMETYIFPFGTEIIDVQCTPTSIQRQTITKKLIVSPDPIILGQTSSKRNEQINLKPKAVDIWYEYDVGTGINDNNRCVFIKIQMFPVQYHPSENYVDWAEKIEVEIQYKEPKHPISIDDEYSFIVLSPSEYNNELTYLVNHKISRGISTKLVTLDEIYGATYFPVQGRDNQEKIKYFIKNAIEKWGTSYVLLVGGSDKFPIRTTHIFIQGDSEIFVSDLYYADIYNNVGDFANWDTNENNIFGEYEWGSLKLTDEVDLYPDVYLGRLACISENEVTTTVNKIITYETNKAYMQDWFTNLIVCGGDTFTIVNGDDSGVNEGEFVNEEIIDIMDSFIPEKLWASNDKLGGTNGIATINAAINKGCGFVDFSGHGDTDRWKTHPHNSSHNIWLPTPSGSYKNTHVAYLSNGEKLPIVISSGCSSSDFDTDTDCFGWAFVSNPNGGGIGSFGPTGLGWAYIGKYVTEGLIEKLVLNTFYSYNNESATTFGEMWGRAIISYISPSMEGIDLKSIEEWQAFGDPTLAIAEESHPPLKPNIIEGPNSGVTDKEYTYTASTTDPDDDKLYYMFDWGDNSFSGWIGMYLSGENATASHIWEEKGKYEIRVKAKDEHGVQSEWSNPLTVSMPRNNLINIPFLRFLRNHPHMFPILRQLLQL